MNDVSLIAGMDANYGMGLNGKLPWSHKTDMAYFKEKTQNSVCIMGRTTYQEILGFKKIKTTPLLVNRISLVVSTTVPQPDDESVIIMPSIDHAMEHASIIYPDKPIFFTGGRRIYEDGIKYINKVYLNKILRDYNCDLKFPYYLLNEFTKDKETLLADDLLNMEFSRCRV